MWPPQADRLPSFGPRTAQGRHRHSRRCSGDSLAMTGRMARPAATAVAIRAPNQISPPARRATTRTAEDMHMKVLTESQARLALKKAILNFDYQKLAHAYSWLIDDGAIVVTPDGEPFAYSGVYQRGRYITEYRGPEA